MSETVATPAAGPPALPLFYTRPRPVEPAAHGAKALRDDPDYGFAAGTNAVPLNGVEFGLAQRHYPIVFSGQGAPFPVAILGLRTEENLFVSAERRWTEGAYIPAYVRRYPFIFIEAGNGQLILAVDEGGGFIVPDGRQRLFDAEGKPTQLVAGALKYCGAYQRNHKATVDFVAALREEDLLVENRAQATIAGGERIALAGFTVVDEARFNKLPAAKVLAWRDKGWLAWVYAHLMSFAAWDQLAAAAAERKKRA